MSKRATLSDLFFILLRAANPRCRYLWEGYTFPSACFASSFETCKRIALREFGCLDKIESPDFWSRYHCCRWKGEDMGDEIFLFLIETFQVVLPFGEVHLRSCPEKCLRLLVHFPHIFLLNRKNNESRIAFPQQRFALLAERYSRRAMIKEERGGVIYVPGNGLAETSYRAKKSQFMFKRRHDRNPFSSRYLPLFHKP